MQHYNVFLERFDKLLSILSKFNKNYKILIAGDFNINILDTSHQTREYVNVLSSHGMRYLIDVPTRVTPKTATAIDNFVTNLQNNYCKASTIVTALSDHDGILLDLDLRIVNKNPTKVT